MLDLGGDERGIADDARLLVDDHERPDDVVALRLACALHQVPLVLQMARVINRYRPELLLRLSRGQAPYGIRSATARDVNRALRQLAFNGLVARAGNRGWRVADPFLSDALLSKPLAAW